MNKFHNTKCLTSILNAIKNTENPIDITNPIRKETYRAIDYWERKTDSIQMNYQAYYTNYIDISGNEKAGEE